MNYFVKKLEEEILALKTFGASIDKLCELAQTKQTVDHWEFPELFDWTNFDTLFTPVNKDDTTPSLNWNKLDENSLYHTFTDGKFYYNLVMYIGQGTDVCFFKVKAENLTDSERTTCSQIVAVKYLAEHKLELLEKKLAELKTKDSTNEQIKNDLKTKLDTVRLIKKLMDDMGLSFDENSKRTIVNWEAEYRK